jgi:hypothetical protein
MLPLRPAARPGHVAALILRLLSAASAASAAVGCHDSHEAPEPEPPPAAHSTTADAGLARGVRFVTASSGPVADVVRTALTEATAAHRRLLVYVGAAWCEPCQRFHHAAVEGLLDATFPDLTLLEFDLDRDQDRLLAARYHGTYIPLFALPSSDGTASGQQIEGSIKGEGAVAQLIPRVTELLGR